MLMPISWEEVKKFFKQESIKLANNKLGVPAGGILSNLVWNNHDCLQQDCSF